MLARLWPPNSKAAQNIAWGVWLIALVVIAVRGELAPASNSVIPCYFEAGHHWVAGEDLYQRCRDTCRYSPFMHAVLAPLCVAPSWLGPLLWRGLNAGIFLLGMRRWLFAVCPMEWSESARAAVLVLTLPLALGSVNNGQANVLMVGAMLWASAAAAEGRWWPTAAGITIATLLKVYPLAFGLILIAAFPRRLGWRLPLCLAVGLAAPFLIQPIAYVARQYPRWLANLLEDDRTRLALQYGYRDLWQLIRAARLPIDHQLYVVLQVALACCLGITCAALGLYGLPRRRLAWHALGMGAVWMTLCGPATESCTYILLAPVLPAVGLDCWRRREPPWVLVTLVLAAAALWSSVVITGIGWGKPLLNYGLQPAGALLLFVVVLREAWAEPALTRQRNPFQQGVSPRPLEAAA